MKWVCLLSYFLLWAVLSSIINPLREVLDEANALSYADLLLLCELGGQTSLTGRRMVCRHVCLLLQGNKTLLINSVNRRRSEWNEYRGKKITSTFLDYLRQKIWMKFKIKHWSSKVIEIKDWKLSLIISSKKISNLFNRHSFGVFNSSAF